MEIGILIGAFLVVAGVIGGLIWSIVKGATEPRGDWWDPEADTTVEHRTRMFDGRNVTEVGRNPDAET